jgi:hypothetical protein
MQASESGDRVHHPAGSALSVMPVASARAASTAAAARNDDIDQALDCAMDFYQLEM